MDTCHQVLLHPSPLWISPYVDDVTLSATVLVLIQDDVTVSSIELAED